MRRNAWLNILLSVVCFLFILFSPHDYYYYLYLYFYICTPSVWHYRLICSSIFGHNFCCFFNKQLGQALRVCLRRQLDASLATFRRSSVLSHTCTARYVCIHVYVCVFVFRICIQFIHFLQLHFNGPLI